MKKKIFFVTTNRADYGIIKNILLKFEKSKKIKTTLVTTGSHFMKKYGYTISEIEKDNFKNIKIIKTKINNSIEPGLIYSLTFTKFYKLFKSKKINYVFLTGDRFEVLAIANVCLLLDIPVIHIHGGELTLGAIDDSIRHSISKIAKIHFVSNIKYKKRLMQLGEDPNSIFVSGSPSVEAIRYIKFFSKKELEKKIKIKLEKKFLVLTLHPETRSNNYNKVENIFKVLKNFKDLKILITMTNFDKGSLKIQRIISKYVDKKKFYLIKSLGHKLYSSLIKHSSGSVGNSSSNIIELPSLKKGAINIGKRQDGRVMADNVINSNYEKKVFKKCLNKLFSNKFLKGLSDVKNPYFKANSSQFIFKKVLELKKISNSKNFYDLNFTKDTKFKLIK